MRDLLPYLKLYKKHWLWLSMGILLALITVSASISLLTLSGWVLTISAISGLGMSIAYETFNYIVPMAIIRLLSVLRTIGRWTEKTITHDVTFKLLTELRVFFFRKISPLIPGNIYNLRNADLLNRLIADISAIDHIYIRLINPIIVGIFGITILSMFLFLFNKTIGLILGAILLLLLLIWPIIFYNLGKKNGNELAQCRTKLRIITLDWLQAYSELTLFGAEKKYRNTILYTQKNLSLKQFNNANFSGIAHGALILTSGLTLLLIVWVLINQEQILFLDPVYSIIIFSSIASFELLIPISGAFHFLGQTITSARRVNEIISDEPKIKFMNHMTKHSGHYSIQFKNVYFQYPNSNHQVLKNINLNIEDQQKIAIIGKTGSGKSTLLQLLFHYWIPQKGIISIANQPLALWNESQLRKTISVVSQRVHILNATLRDNLRIASPNIEDHKLLQILNDFFLEHLLEDKGLDTWLGNGGYDLSGGEKRRIDIIRSILHDAPILILDEPTEGLDKKTEKKVMKKLEYHFKLKTVIIITHRLIKLDKMDSVFLIEEGKITKYHSRSSLLKNKYS
ncbi:ATP-binding/permease protein [Candidatus Photodesmus katoptron]|uniref:heme ABC transporter ATP-binding protein/permease CydC n=1 Tax=Candidatus Photodesmus anomalopis TaxID=28176 RepID=UPI0004D5A88C|nr:cysteine/glutathione ABC transporter ATP-binding protein/permease CydC [Candidatus Photodesmus katoptron]KEY90706.1 ATP-binding/permease protein [Candidatus Photodesmus katoptron]